MITKGVDNEITLKAFPNPDPNLLDVSFFLFKKKYNTNVIYQSWNTDNVFLLQEG